MRRLVLLAAVLGLAAGCGSMSAIYPTGLLGADGGIGDGGGGSGGGGNDGGSADGGILAPKDLKYATAAPACSPTGGPAFTLLVTAKNLGCGPGNELKHVDHVELDIWSFPAGPLTLVLDPSKQTGQALWCHGSGTQTCVTATKAKVVLTDWPGRPGPAGSFLLDLPDGTKLAGGFSAHWCLKPVPCR